MCRPEISVIVPVYNARPHLEPLLDSLLSQSEQSLQIVAVDDGSSDGSLSVLQSAAARDSRLLVLTQPNRGASAARNLGLAHARGNWIGFADSDDWLDPQALRTWREHGEHTNVEVVLGNGFKFFDTPGEIRTSASANLLRHHLPAPVFSGADWIRHCVRHSDWAHFVWLQLIRREALVRNNFLFDEHATPHEDVVWSMHVGLRTERMGFVAAPLYGYRIHSNSLTHNPAVGALHRRARGYLVVIKQFIAAANSPEIDILVRRALMRHAQREGRILFGIMKSGVLPPAMRCEIAREFIARGLGQAMFRGAEDVRTLWRAVRCWKRMRDCARTPPEQVCQG